MADKTFATDFSELTTVQGTDKLLINGTSSSDTEYCQVQTLIDDMTGIDAISTGEIIRKNSDGTLGGTGATYDEYIRYADETVGDLTKFYGNGLITETGFKAASITSWQSSYASGLFIANLSNGGYSYVGRIGVDNGTRGVSLGFINDGTTQEIAIHASTAGVVSSTPQLLAKQDWVEVYTGQNYASFKTVDAATTTSLPSYTVSGFVLTADANGALIIDGYALEDNDYVLLNHESSPVIGGTYIVTSSGSASTPFVLTYQGIDTITLVSDTSTTQTGVWIRNSASLYGTIFSKFT